MNHIRPKYFLFVLLHLFRFKEFQSALIGKNKIKIERGPRKFQLFVLPSIFFVSDIQYDLMSNNYYYWLMFRKE